MFAMEVGAEPRTLSGGLWVSLAIKPANEKASKRDDPNRMGSHIAPPPAFTERAWRTQPAVSLRASTADLESDDGDEPYGLIRAKMLMSVPSGSRTSIERLPHG